VRPTEASERRRAEVVDYARRLVGAALGCEVRTVPWRLLGPVRFSSLGFGLGFSSADSVID
jgi:hypothetical protein